MKNFKLLCIIIACANIFAACKKDKTEPTELSKLPAATQTGANTFGCLVNGKAWVAQTDCKFLCDARVSISYDPISGGYIGITSLLENSSKDEDQHMELTFDSANYKSNFIFNSTSHLIGGAYSNRKDFTNCRRLDNSDIGTSSTGIINVSNFNLQTGIVAGSFEFSLTKPGCTSILVTNGRFDCKLF